MDDIDDFEFKPITEGLGFHKKPASKGFVKELKVESTLFQPKSQVNPASKPFTGSKAQAAAPVSKPITPSKSSIRTPSKPSSPFSGLLFEPTLSHEMTESLGSAVGGNVTLQATSSVSSKPQETAQPRWTPHPKNQVEVIFPAIIFDFIVVLGLSCLFSFAALLVGQLDPLVIVKMAGTDLMTALSIVVLIFSAHQLYAIISRSFVGGTMGEWAFEAEVGTKEQQASALYPLQVMARSLLVALTGYIVLPLLSVILRRDIAGEITGLHLYKY